MLEKKENGPTDTALGAFYKSRMMHFAWSRSLGSQQRSAPATRRRHRTDH